MYNVLVIGCGNIGAQYDMHNNEIQSHVKAWHLNPITRVFIYDTNPDLMRLVSDKYSCDVVKSIDVETLTHFDCVSICTPTFTHRDFLEKALAAKVSTIICEKPVSNNYSDLEHLKKLYNNNRSKILVNYIRRFLPAYSELKKIITSIMVFEELTNINIRYQRGFINNCSHAFDLVTYLIGAEIYLNNINRFNLIADHFSDDPTLSMQALWANVNFNVQGLSNVCFSHFEIDIYFKYHKIVIRNAGDTIEVYKAENADNNLQPLVIMPASTKHNCLKNYMVYVTDYAVKLMNGQIAEDNFIDSVNLNQQMLKYKEN
jgi:predicted dehydrogenase